MRFSSHNFLPSAMGIGTDRYRPFEIQIFGRDCRKKLEEQADLQLLDVKRSHHHHRALSTFESVYIHKIFDRWSAFMEDGKVKVLNVENVPSESKVSGGEKLRPSKKHNQKMEQNIQGLKTRERPTIFPFLQINGGSSDYIISRAILSTKNENVDEINDQLVDRFIGEQRVYYSFDEAEDDKNNFYPMEFLNSLNVSGLPPHYLRLKIGCPIILLRDIDHSNGLCNGTRLICKGFQMNVICNTPNFCHF
ncbi:hypothetical protein LXL04_003787 [Taraxacum kok-saghyz]